MILLFYSIPMFQDISLLKFQCLGDQPTKKLIKGRRFALRPLVRLAIPVYGGI